MSERRYATVADAAKAGDHEAVELDSTSAAKIIKISYSPRAKLDEYPILCTCQAFRSYEDRWRMDGKYYFTSNFKAIRLRPEFQK